MQAGLAEKKVGMNWELAAMKMVTVQGVLDSAQDTFPHDCKVVIVTREENDGGPYGSLNNAPFYYLVVNGSSDTDPRFVAGIKDVLSAV